MMYFKRTEHNFPNLVVEAGYKTENDQLINYKLTPAEGYVFYDRTEENFYQESPEHEPIPVIHYFTLAYLPKNYNFNNFPYVAELRENVDENFIF